MRVAFDVARRVERTRSNGSEIVQRVVAVARALAGEHETRFPSCSGLPDDLAFSEECGSRIEVMARDFIRRESVPAGEAERELYAEFVGDVLVRYGAEDV